MRYYPHLKTPYHDILYHKYKNNVCVFPQALFLYFHLFSRCHKQRKKCPA